MRQPLGRVESSAKGTRDRMPQGVKFFTTLPVQINNLLWLNNHYPFRKNAVLAAIAVNIQFNRLPF